MSGSSEGAYVQVADERRPCGLLELEHGKVPVDSRLAGDDPNAEGTARQRARHSSPFSSPLRPRDGLTSARRAVAAGRRPSVRRGPPRRR